MERLLALGRKIDLEDLEAAIAGELERRGSARAQRIWRAMMLAPTLEVCVALLEGEPVPLERLDPDWVAAFGLRETAA